MATAGKGTDDIVAMMPRSLQARFASLGGYVAMVIEEAGITDPPLDREDAQFIQLAALVYALDHFLRAGTHAARSAALEFESLGSDTFMVGATPFTKDGKNTLRGERLADALRASITDERMLRLISSSRSMRDLIRSLARLRRRGAVG